MVKYKVKNLPLAFKLIHRIIIKVTLRERNELHLTNKLNIYLVNKNILLDLLPACPTALAVVYANLLLFYN